MPSRGEGRRTCLPFSGPATEGVLAAPSPSLTPSNPHRNTHHAHAHAPETRPNTTPDAQVKSERRANICQTSDRQKKEKKEYLACFGVTLGVRTEALKQKCVYQSPEPPDGGKTKGRHQEQWLIEGVEWTARWRPTDSWCDKYTEGPVSGWCLLLLLSPSLLLLLPSSFPPPPPPHPS